MLEGGLGLGVVVGREVEAGVVVGLWVGLVVVVLTVVGDGVVRWPDIDYMNKLIFDNVLTFASLK